MATAVPPSPASAPKIIQEQSLRKTGTEAKNCDYTSSGLHGRGGSATPGFVGAVQAVEAILRTPVWLLIQDAG